MYMTFVIGIFGLFLNRKNIIILLMSIELMLLSVNINLVAFSSFPRIFSVVLANTKLSGFARIPVLPGFVFAPSAVFKSPEGISGFGGACLAKVQEEPGTLVLVRKKGP